MVVIPTEKQFDWRHAPTVLISIVMLNCFVFFFLQSSDNEKLYSALDSYLDSGYLKQEQAIFETYVKETQGLAALAEIEDTFISGGEDAVALSLLLHKPFFEHLNTVAEDHYGADDLESWRQNRKEIQQEFNRISWVKHGLIANNIHFFDFISSQFLHGDIMHLLGNMFFLAICGFAVEAAIGHWRFLLFYLICGVVAGLSQAASNWQSATPLIGASGAVSGVMAMYLAIFRLRKIEFFYWIFFFVGYFRAPALVILPLYIGKELFNYFGDSDSNVAFLAHAGGFVAGGILIIVSMLLFKKTVNNDYIENEIDTDLRTQQTMADIYLALEKCRFKDAFTLVNSEIKKNGETFELALIRYNIMKIFRGKHFSTSVLRLWQQTNLKENEIARLDAVWKEHPELHHKLADQPAISLGIKFAACKFTDSAEQIFKLSVKRKSQNEELNILAKRLARELGKRGHKDKQEKYEKFSERFLNGELTNGAL